MSNPRTLFKWVTTTNRTRRHVSDGCSAVAHLYATPDEHRNLPACPACLDHLRDTLAREGIHPAVGRNEPVRCAACGSWQQPGLLCRVCGAAT